MSRFRIGCGSLLLAAAASPAFAQGYSTSFDDLTGWLPGGAWVNDAGVLNGIAGTGSVFSPFVPLAGLAKPTLSFRCAFQTLSGSRRIAIIPVYPHPVIHETLGVGPCGEKGTWHRHTVALDPAWEVVQVAFILDGPHGGWSVDDLAIGESQAAVDLRTLGALGAILFLALATTAAAIM